MWSSTISFWVEVDAFCKVIEKINNCIFIEKKMNWKCLSTLWKFKLGSSRALICLLTQTETLKLELLCVLGSLLYSWASAPSCWKSPCPVALCLLYPHCWIWQSTLAALSKSQLPAVSCDRTKPVLTAAAFFRAVMPFIKSFLFIKKTTMAVHIQNSNSFK